LIFKVIFFGGSANIFKNEDLSMGYFIIVVEIECGFCASGDRL